MDIRPSTKIRGAPTPLKDPPTVSMECRVTIEIKRPQVTIEVKPPE